MALDSDWISDNATDLSDMKNLRNGPNITQRSYNGAVRDA